MRLTVNQVMQSRIPQALKKCANDVPYVMSAVNEAQQRLINAGGETGWYGGWQKTVFNVSRCHPYLTLPRDFARIINLAVCRFPIRIQNEFYEMLEAGIGLQDFCKAKDWCGAEQGFERGGHPTWRDVDPVNQKLAIALTNPLDAGKNVVITGRDQNGNEFYSMVGNENVKGFTMVLSGAGMTFSDSQVSFISGVQKDATVGDVLLYQIDMTTGAQVLLSRYAPDEITTSYRRYFFKSLPCSCDSRLGNQSPCIEPVQDLGTVQLTAMCKLEYIPAVRPTDYLIIGNIPALKEEALAIIYGEMDTVAAQNLADVHHKAAIKKLQDELRHYEGELIPAVNFAPFGTARTRRALSAVRFG